MPVPCAPELWEYREHTRVKHELLEKYLRAWIMILGRRRSRIYYFDCFAGRGEYSKGKPGSPVIAVRIATELDRYFGEFVCVNIESNRDNYSNLERVLSKEPRSPKVKVINRYGEFATVARNILGQVGARLAPSFFFIDPSGFSGIPFDLIKDILSIQRTEVFYNYQERDIERFRTAPDAEASLDELFGTREWQGWQHRLSVLYERQLHEVAKVSYTCRFRVCETNRRRTLYYLIHATNNFTGAKIMKEIMYKQGPSGAFAYLGPDEFFYRSQLKLFDPDRDSLGDYLLARFAGRTLTYDGVLEESHMDTSFIDKDSREILQKLRSEGVITVQPGTSKTERGLRGNDLITFPPR